MADLLPPRLADRLDALRGNLNGVLQGKPGVIERLLVVFLSGGCVLFEDVPGVGKTTLAKALAKSIDAVFHRVQFTPDLLPADILGSSIYNPRTGEFDFRPGPVFCNVLLADEINRASPRTQSALLEAMGERQATVEGISRPLPEPFLVLATQNPIEYQGTYPLPEAQLDRFAGQLELGYPGAETEAGILYGQATVHPLETLSPVMTVAEVIEAQQAARRVNVERTVADYLVAVVNRTRQDERLRLGASPRGSLMLFRAAQAAALLAGRGYALPDDVQHAARFVLPHRLILMPKARYAGLTKRHIVEEVLGGVKVPT